MKLYRTRSAILIHHEDQFFHSAKTWTALVNRDNLHHELLRELVYMPAVSEGEQILEKNLLAPIENQEVWAAGVTYQRSREARMEESRQTGGSDFYDKVYSAERPELFFKALGRRVSGPGEPVNIRSDSTWNVPEPELTLFINSNGHIVGYTVGNDMSSRSIEGENPLYLPQAKVYERSAALGPCLLVPASPIDPRSEIHMEIFRSDERLFSDQVPLSRMKRKHAELAGWLVKACRFPDGCYLMTGTCLVPGNDFTLRVGDRVQISIDGIGTLTNTIEMI